MDRLGTIWSDGVGRLRAWWGAQNRQNRTIALIGVAVVLAAIGSLAFLYARGPSYETLFSNLAADDAASVTQRLKDDKVPYRLSNDGKTVYVPAADLSEERVAIAGSGVIKGGTTGYELFDRTNFGMTAFQEKLDKTRAIQGELERTIDGLDPVEAARVHIATPDDTLYTSEQSPTTASIAIKTKPGESLSAQEVKGVTMLVADAVANLKPENVTIVDQNGQILLPGSGPGSDADGSPDALKLTGEQLFAKQRYETNLQQNIQSMLDDTLGAHHAVARVSTKMDFDANSSESKVYAPQGTVLSSQAKRESYNGTQPAARAAVGVPGTTSNIGTYQALQNGNSTGKYNKTENTSNFDISVQNLKHVDAPGKVLQTSVAVLVNDTAAAAPGASGAQKPYQLTPANVAQIRNAVIAAAGLNLAQGDQISVEAVPFNPALAQQNTAAPATRVLGLPLWVLLTLGGVAALIALGLIAARMRTGTWNAGELPSFDAAISSELPPFEDTALIGSPGIAAPLRSPADATREQMLEYVTSVARENPEGVAKLVKLWLAE